MQWIDVFGPPGVGKSTLCDALWHPHAIDTRNASVLDVPYEWGEFLGCVNDLLLEIDGHPSFFNCLGMVNRSIFKMLAVYHDPRDDIYIQTGFAQRGLGFGWRLENPEDVRAYYELMPTSIGVVSLWAPTEIVQERNRLPHRAERGENRDYMVPLMERPRQIALDVLRWREVPVLELDTRRPPEELRQAVIEFRDSHR